MIHASLGKKSPPIRRIGQGEVEKLGREDLLTSTVFGTMTYLPNLDVLSILNQIFSFGWTDEFISTRKDVKIEFWKRFKAVEPDFIITVDPPNMEEESPLTIMVEVKLDACSSNKNNEHQLARQWRVLPFERKRNAMHIYLVVDCNQLNHDKNTNTIKHHVHVVSWTDVTHRLQACAQRLSPKARELCLNLSEVLSREDIRSFQGFSGLSSLPDISPSNKPIIRLCSFESQEPVMSPPESVFFQGVEYGKPC